MTVGDQSTIEHRTMKKNVPFVKYTCYGNNFVILDETQEKVLSEKDLPSFAGSATDVNFGVGADNLLVIQKCTNEVLHEINSNYKYWKTSPAAAANYIFRMFEPNGDEALCCGNGLMCISHYLHSQLGVENASIMTEVPLIEPNVIPIGCQAKTSRSWVNLGNPRRIPDSIIGKERSWKYRENIQLVEDLTIKFRKHDLSPYTDSTEIKLNGFIIFTGEPHLVVFPEEGGISVDGLSDVVFADSEGNRGAGPIFRQRIRFGTWFLDRIGYFINTHYRKMFPIGMNVNLVRKRKQTNTVEYRCYERGINKETLACGTGAMAVAYTTAQMLGLNEGDIAVLPHRCRWFKRDADIIVKPGCDGWVLNGQPRRIMNAEFINEE